ncbi:MAG: uracil-DNA glycosylase family protein, partial [Candidatus Limnocylindrales bacterium]
VDGYRCWSGYNARNTDRFTEYRMRYGFQNCFITNVVKCGVQGGKPDEHDIKRCAGFLYRELALVDPSVIVCVGQKTRDMLELSMSTWPNQLSSAPEIIYMTHYSAASRGMSVEELWRRWDREAIEIRQELRRRGLHADEPSSGASA